MSSWLPSDVPVPSLCPGRDTRKKPTVSTMGPRARELRSPAGDDRRLAVVPDGERFCRPRRDEKQLGHGRLSSNHKVRLTLVGRWVSRVERVVDINLSWFTSG